MRHGMDARLGGAARGYVWCRELLDAAGSLRFCFGRVLAHMALAAFFKCVRNLLLLFETLSTAPSIFTFLTTQSHDARSRSLVSIIAHFTFYKITFLKPWYQGSICRIGSHKTIIKLWMAFIFESLLSKDSLMDQCSLKFSPSFTDKRHLISSVESSAMFISELN